MEALRKTFGEESALPTGFRYKNAGDILTEGGETFKERHKVYGNNFLKVGPMLVAMFPDGITLKTAEDFIRFELFMLKVVKCSRYAENFSKGGHMDSVHDDMVYSAMLEYVDTVLREGSSAVPIDPNTIAVSAVPHAGDLTKVDQK